MSDEAKFKSMCEAIRRKPIRTCLNVHECFACCKQITYGQRYHDGGYGRRMHVDCVPKMSVPYTAADTKPSAPEP